MGELFEIDGYWKSDNTPFKNYIVFSSDNTPPPIDEDKIFFYGLTEKRIKTNMREAENNAYEFVITRYEKI